MKTILFIGGMALIMGLGHVALGQGANTSPTFPKTNGSLGDRGYQEALELQKETNADILLYFYRHDNKDEKGLCNWWERFGLQNISRHLQHYIKVKVQAPLKSKERETFSAFKFNKTPAVYVVRASGGYPVRCQVFNWTNNRPQLKSEKELIEMFEKASGPKAVSDDTEPES